MFFFFLLDVFWVSAIRKRNERDQMEREDGSCPGLARRPSPRTHSRGVEGGWEIYFLSQAPRRKDMALFMRIATRSRDSLVGGATLILPLRGSRVGGWEEIRH